MQPSRITFIFVVLLAITLEGRPAQSLLVLASARDSSSAQRRPELVVIPAGTAKECLSEVGAYYGSDFPPTAHTNASSAEECCRMCQASPQCNVWNWCGAAEGCLYPSNLADADGKIGVSFRTCNFKAQPITVSGTTALPPETLRTGDMAAWTSGIPLATKLLKPAAGYNIYKGVQMPYGSGSADFACAKSDTSKNVCELPGDIVAAREACDAIEQCKGFQLCFRSTAQSSVSSARIRLKGAGSGPLNLTTAMFNPYCSMYVSEDPERAFASSSAAEASVPTAARRALMQAGKPAAAPALAAGSFNPLVGRSASNISAAPAGALAVPAGAGGMRRNRAPAPEMLRPAVPSEAPGSSAELDALLGAGASNSSIVVTAAPAAAGRTNATARNTPKGFDKFTPDYKGSSGSTQVTRNSENYASSGGLSASNPSVRAGVGSSRSPDDVITPADGVTDIAALRASPSSAGEGYNRTVKAAAVLVPLEYKSPMEIYPGAIFRYRPCGAAAAPIAYLRADLMAVPSTRKDNASAYAIHAWMRVPFQNNATCNRSCVYKLADNAYFNVEDSYIARARPAYITTNESYAKAPIADLSMAANGSVLAAPLLYIPANEVANSTTERGLRFQMLRSNSTSYINELVRLYYYTAQIALGNKGCSAGFPGLRTALDYIQAALQAQVAQATGQDYGSFATLNGVPLSLQFITAQDVTAGARRGYGQSCLAEPNALYDGAVLVAGADNLATSAEDCCRSCWALGGRPGPAGRAAYGGNSTVNGTYGGDAAAAAARGSGYVSSAPAGAPSADEGPSCNAWTYCASPLGCKTANDPNLYQQGFCELKHSGDIARHRPVQASRAASGFISGRTTGVLPQDMVNLFGAGSI